MEKKFKKEKWKEKSKKEKKEEKNSLRKVGRKGKYENVDVIELQTVPVLSRPCQTQLTQSPLFSPFLSTSLTLFLPSFSSSHSNTGYFGQLLLQEPSSLSLSNLHLSLSLSNLHQN